MRRVVLLVETSNAYGRRDKPPEWLTPWRGDGIMARIETPSIARALRGLRVPIVDMSTAVETT